MEKFLTSYIIQCGKEKALGENWGKFKFDERKHWRVTIDFYLFFNEEYFSLSIRLSPLRVS